MSQGVIKQIEGRAVPFPEDNVDTDQIAPTQEALYVVNWEELADVFCVKHRLKADGSINQECVLNDPRYQGARILIGGRNFGCGSSREHATQGTKARYDAVVALSFAPIYADNAYAIGLPAVEIDETSMSTLLGIVRSDPQTVLSLDLETKAISRNSQRVSLHIDEAKRQGFLQGTWDERARLYENLLKTRAILDNSAYVRGY